MNKKNCLTLTGITLFYLMISFFYFRISDIAHCDGYWYLKLAENIAKGHGLIENIVLYFYPKLPILDKFPHPVGVYWNPLNSIILSGIYKIFGISEFTSRLGVLIIDGLVVFFMYFLCIKLYPDNKWIAFFSSVIFIIHPFTLGMRGLSGMPESYDLFFITMFCYFLYKSITINEKYFLLSGLLGGLSYLSRNEGLWTFPTMILTFLSVKYIIKNNQNINWKMLVLGILIFLITISPWEIRNRILFGNQANIMKKNLLLTTEYFDIWKYGKVFSFKEYISSGFTNIILRRIASFYYKSITFMDILTWPLGLFLLWGVAGDIKNLLFLPAYIYLLLTYVGISILFPASQYSAFHSPGTLLVFFIILSISGIFNFSSAITKNEKKAKFLGMVISFLLISFYISGHLKSYKDFNGTFYNKNKAISQIIYNFAEKNNALDDVFMIHDPPRFHYYTNIKMVQTPMDEDWNTIKDAIKRYNCKYLILIGTIPQFFSSLYEGEKNYPELELVYEEKTKFVIPVTGGSDKIKIYKINLQ